MPNRRTRALLAVLISLATAVLLAGCSQTPQPQQTQSPSASPSPSEPLAFGQSATVAGFEMTPRNVRPAHVDSCTTSRVSPSKGHGVKVMIKVAKVRQADLSGDDAELTVPVASIVDSAGQAVRMDDYLGMIPVEAQSAEYALLYATSYQLACIEEPGDSTVAALYFSLPKGFVPETLVIDGGAGQEATWLLP